MSYSLNSDINCGSKKFHVQTEFYKSSQKIVTNIFINGNAIKRIEKHFETGKIEEEINKQHCFVIEKLNSTLKEKLECKEGREKNLNSNKKSLESPTKETPEIPDKKFIKKIVNNHLGEKTLKKTKKFIDTLFGIFRD